MDKILQWLTMGGYGIYVWPAYALVAGTLALQLFLPWRRLKHYKKKQNASHAQTQ
jgi:heme exporter protein D